MTRPICILLAIGTVGLSAHAASAADTPRLLVGTYYGAAAFTSQTTVSFRGTGVATGTVSAPRGR